METSKLKNMVVLRNLPSNLIDEAIVVLKNKKEAKKFQKIEQSRDIKINESEEKDKEYILREAEMIVNDYISKIEQNDKKIVFNKDAKNRYNKLKKYSIAITIISLLQAIIIIF